jgi:hypothetical protein
MEDEYRRCGGRPTHGGGKVAKHCKRTLVEKPATLAGVLAPSPTPVVRLSAGSPAVSPHGLRLDSSTRENGFGSVTTLLHSPAKGMCSSAALQFVPSVRDGCFPENAGQLSDMGMCGAMRGRLPQLNFPVFDGDNPKLWTRRSQDYFDMYSVDPHMWIKVATMHLTGAAARWFSSRTDECRGSTWPVFY